MKVLLGFVSHLCSMDLDRDFGRYKWAKERALVLGLSFDLVAVLGREKPHSKNIAFLVTLISLVSRL